VNIAQAVRFVKHNQIPSDGLDVGSFGLGELIRADDRAIGIVKGQRFSVLTQGVVALGFEDQALQVELVLQFLVPLLTQVGRNNDQNTAAAFGPAHRYNKTSLNGLAEADFVGENYPARERVAAGEQCRFDLMGIEIDLRINQRRC